MHYLFYLILIFIDIFFLKKGTISKHVQSFKFQFHWHVNTPSVLKYEEFCNES